MLYCDKPDWVKASDKELAKIVDGVNATTNGLEDDTDFEFEVDGEYGTIQVSGKSNGGLITDLHICLWWADRDGETPDEPIEDNLTYRETIEKCVKAINA